MIYYTDGSAHPNPGKGGFGVVILDNNENLINTYAKGQAYTTNNEQELKAILYAIMHSVTAEEPARIYSDSAYSINICTCWMYNWAGRDWKTAKGKDIENKEIVQTIYYLLTKYPNQISFHKVKGHTNNKWNNLADELATQI